MINIVVKWFAVHSVDYNDKLERLYGCTKNSIMVIIINSLHKKCLIISNTLSMQRHAESCKVIRMVFSLNFIFIVLLGTYSYFALFAKNSREKLHQVRNQVRSSRNGT